MEKRKFQQYGKLKAVATAGGLLMSVYTHAEQLKSSIELAGKYHDNALLVPEDEKSDTERRALFNVGYSEQYSKGDLKFDYNLQNTAYQHDSFDDRNTSTGYGIGNLYLLPERFSWMLDHLRDDVRISSVERDVPSNRSIKSSTSTGPTIFYDLTEIDSLKLSMRMFETRYSDLDFKNNESVLSSIELGHRLSATQMIYATVSESKVEYDFDLLNYDNSSLRLDYLANWRKSSVRLMVGQNEYRPDFGSDTSGAFYEASFDYKNAPGNRVFATVGKNFSTNLDSDAYPATTRGSLVNQADVGFDSTDSLSSESEGSQDQYEQNYFNLGFTQSIGTPNLLSFKAGSKEFEYLNDSLDEKEYYAEIVWARLVSEKVKVRFLTGYEESKFNDLKREDENIYYGCSVDVKITNDLSFNGFVLNEENESSLPEQEYEDLSLGLSLKYILL